MKIDYKKIEKEVYSMKTTPCIINIKKMNFITFKGYGNPSSDDSNFKHGIGLLYKVAYTLSMSYKSDYVIDDFVNYVVPPLEGYWWQKGIKGYDSSRKDLFEFILKIRLPDFIKETDVLWAKNKVSKKYKEDLSEIEYKEIEEGLVVQCLHIGCYDDEVYTTSLMHDFIEKEGYELDFSDYRYRHELYISDARKTDISKLKTILRHPVKMKVK